MWCNHLHDILLRICRGCINAGRIGGDVTRRLNYWVAHGTAHPIAEILQMDRSVQRYRSTLACLLWLAAPSTLFILHTFGLDAMAFFVVITPNLGKKGSTHGGECCTPMRQRCVALSTRSVIKTDKRKRRCPMCLHHAVSPQNAHFSTSISGIYRTTAALVGHCLDFMPHTRIWYHK